MRTLTTHRSLKTALRTLCCAGALTACSTWATVVTWQSSPGGSVGTTNHLSLPGYANMASTGASNQTLFKSAPESGANNEISAIKAAALNDKLQARDTDFQQQAPSTIANPGGAFNEQFVSVPNYQFVSTAPSSTSLSSTSTAGGVVPVPEMSSFFPIIGLIVAVSCTRILRRRRAAQLSAARILV